MKKVIMVVLLAVLCGGCGEGGENENSFEEKINKAKFKIIQEKNVGEIYLNACYSGTEFRDNWIWWKFKENQIKDETIERIKIDIAIYKFNPEFMLQYDTWWWDKKSVLLYKNLPGYSLQEMNKAKVEILNNLGLAGQYLFAGGWKQFLKDDIMEETEDAVKIKDCWRMKENIIWYKDLYSDKRAEIEKRIKDKEGDK